MHYSVCILCIYLKNKLHLNINLKAKKKKKELKFIHLFSF